MTPSGAAAMVATPRTSSVRSAERAKQVDDARKLVASGDRGLIAAGLAELVRRPGNTHGRRYLPGGANQLGQSIPPGRIVMAATADPITVTPSYAYATLDVDYDRALTDDARARMAAQVDRLIALVRPTGTPIVRIASGGGGGGQWPNEHVWLVTGHHTLRADARHALAAALRVACPDLQLVGGLVDGPPAAQQIRPPGARHRTGIWVPIDDPEGLYETLAAPGPTSEGWAALLAALSGDPTPTATRRRRRARQPFGVDVWAKVALDRGHPSGVDRSAATCKLVGHLLSRGWTPDRITARLLDSPAADYLRDRQGAVDLPIRVRRDVDRIAGKHHTTRRRRPVHPVLAQIAAHWDLLELSDGTRPRWMTQSGRAVLGALARLHTLGRRPGQRDVGIHAGVSARTVGRTYRRWAAHGVLQLHLDDAGDVASVEIDPAQAARLLPPDLTATPDVHTPDERLRVHDAWTHRPAGTPHHPALLGTSARRVWLRLRRLGQATPAELAQKLGVSPRQVRRCLSRLAVHRLVIHHRGHWLPIHHPEAARRVLDRAALALHTGQVLEQRTSHAVAEQLAWATALTQGSTQFTGGTRAPPNTLLAPAA